MELTILFCCLMLLAPPASSQDKSDLTEDLDVIKRAFRETNSRDSVVTNSTERIGFWGEWNNGDRLTQVDDKVTQGQYRLNRNPRGLHDFYLVKNHMREQVLPTGDPSTGAKTVTETVFRDGQMRMRFQEASVAIFRRVPKGWFNVETFTLESGLPPAASYLQAVDYQFILRQNALLDLSLLQDKYIAKIDRLSGKEIPRSVTGRCFSVGFADSGFVLRSSLGLGSNDFSGFEFTDTFRNDLFSNATVFFKVCVSPEDAEGPPVVLFTETSRSGSDIPTRLAGKDITMRFLGDKKTLYKYVDDSDIQFPNVLNASAAKPTTRFVVGWVAVAAAVALLLL